MSKPLKIETMTRGYRNNNPLNIEKSKGTPWLGEVSPEKNTDGRFAQFTTMAHGYRAAFKLLHNYQRLHGCTMLGDFINRFAPPVENNTRAYIATVSQRTGLADVSQIDTTDAITMCLIVAAMSYVENGIPADMEDVRAGWELYQKNQ